MTKIPAFLVLLAFFLGGPIATRAATPPQTGDTAPDFSLRTLDGHAVQLNALTAKTPVVLVVLRGWPGYQCPLCTAQVHDFVLYAGEFASRGARVLMVYPGPAGKLQEHAQDFLRDKSWPADFLLVLDPDYTFTQAYGLRWDAKNETAYPSTFLVSRAGKVEYALISRTHGGRAAATAVLEALK